MPEQKTKPPSELSLELFAAHVAADQSLPQAIREAIKASIDKGTPALLDAIKKKIEGIDEA